MEWLTKELFIVYGPLSIGWILYLWERYDAKQERKIHREEQKQSTKELLTIIEAYHTATDAMERVLASAINVLHGGKK